jgi:hypothetical protein
LIFIIKKVLYLPYEIERRRIQVIAKYTTTFENIKDYKAELQTLIS